VLFDKITLKSCVFRAKTERKRIKNLDIERKITMSKSTGIGRGGPRANSGRPRKALSEAILEGTRKSRLKIVKFEGVDLIDETT